MCKTIDHVILALLEVFCIKTLFVPAPLQTQNFIEKLLVECSHHHEYK